MRIKDDDRLLLSIREAARLSDVSPATIRRELDDGNLEEVRLRDRRLVSMESLKKALTPKK